ncbi:hypothetical protein GQ55_5G123200 [Panicum hallii var. hallii]|uniref:Cytochrome P450 n=1 Tax=Panicum hallii var. hallii TaxID=1504633 RepID=A0A2T7DFI5_9POAL|nr:hypothetical protein GQ55_5G123200 [Panicum hallii var. hallii]
MELPLTSPPLVLLLTLLPALHALLRLRRDPKKQPRADGLRSYPLVGTFPHLVKNQHRFLEWSTDVVRGCPTHTMSFKVPGLGGAAITANPANVEHIAKTNFANYPKGEVMVSTIEDFLGHGIFKSDGDQWLWQRKAASYEFSKRSLRNFVVDTVRFEIVERLLPLLERAARDGRTLDVQDVLERFAFNNICRVAFGEDPACLAEDEEGRDGIIARFMTPIKSLWRVQRLLSLEPERRLREALDTVHDYADRIVRERRERERAEAGLASKDDFLSRYAASGEHSDESLRDVVTNFLLAGRDTTSSALTWFFCFDELREMQYLHAAVTESMRLYPPVAMDTHGCKHDDFLPDGTFVGIGWQVTYSAYAMARVEDIWGKDCEEFKPERWLSEDGAFQPESTFRYPVFHAGPRMCLGKEMAYIQMKSIVACVLERFSFRFVGGEERPGLVLSFTLRMKGGLAMQVDKRS